MRLIFSTALLALAIGMAVWRGGGPERSFAAILAAMFSLDRIGHLALGESGQSIEQMHAVLDLAALGAMATVMLAARRLWPIWACSLQLLSAVAHWARPLGERVPEIAVRILATAPFLLICLTLILAVAAHRLRLKRRGFDPSWRRWSRRPAM
jgi:hypothetical protein